ncbi:MAG: hypothetical protein R2764_12845 [Bacteroidales bacterium]
MLVGEIENTGSIEIPSPITSTDSARLTIMVMDAYGNIGSDESDDLFSIKTGGTIYGQISDIITGEAIPNALVFTNTDIYSELSNDSGEYCISGIPFGYGYDIFCYAEDYNYKIERNQNITYQNPDINIDLHLFSSEYSLELIEIPFVNPAISKVEEGGILHRYYKVWDTYTQQPVHYKEVGTTVPDGIFILMKKELLILKYHQT